MIYRLEEPGRAAPLFAGWEETMVWSCLQNVLGEIYVDDPVNPRSAMAVLGDFRFLAGEPRAELAAHEMRENLEDAGYAQGFRILVPQSEAWERVIAESFAENSVENDARNNARNDARNNTKETAGRAVRVVRYATKKEPGIFDTMKLKAVAEGLPDGFSLQMIDESLYYKCRQQEWSRDLVSQYADYARYRELGLGVAVVKGDVLVAGASSYSSYRDGIEIEIDTQEEYRRQGLAYACGAKLILECLERNLYPSWDAQNQGSLALAEKLGYHFDREYVAFEVTG